MLAVDTSEPQVIKTISSLEGESRISREREVPVDEDFEDLILCEVFDDVDYEVNASFLHLNNEESVNLLEPVRVQEEDDRLVINDWGIEMTVEQSKDITGLLARRYLEMYSGALNQSLSPEDEAYYLNIQDYVDDLDFRIGRTPPRYFEIELLSKKPLQFSIAGKKVTIHDRSFKDTFEIFNVGEIIGCDLTFGKDRKLNSVSNTRIIQYSDSVDIQNHVPSEQEQKLAENIKGALPVFQEND